MQAGRQHLVAQSERSLQNSGRAGCAFQVPDVRLHRSQCDRVGRKVRAVQYLDHALRFHHITYRVDVPWPSMSVAVAGDKPAFCQARSTHNFCPIGLGAVMPLPLPSLAPAMPRSTA